MEYKDCEQKYQKKNQFWTFFKGSCLGFMVCVFLIFVLICGGIVLTVQEIGKFMPDDNNSTVCTYLSDYSNDDFNTQEQIAVIDIYGVITQEETSRVANSEQIIHLLRKAAKDNSVAIILNINSPGGEVTASDEIYRVVKEVKEQYKIPIITCMRSVCASGGYYIAAASDYIIANPTTITGSIGVIFNSLNYSKLFHTIGLESEVYKSGDMKDVLNGARKRTEKEIELIQHLVDENYLQFATIVAEGRPGIFTSADDVKNHPIIGDARILSGKQAYDVGLVDELGTFDNAIKIARDLAKKTKAKTVRYSTSGRFLQDLFLMKAQNNFLKQILPLENVTLKPGYTYYILPTVSF